MILDGDEIVKSVVNEELQIRQRLEIQLRNNITFSSAIPIRYKSSSNEEMTYWFLCKGYDEIYYFDFERGSTYTSNEEIYDKITKNNLDDLFNRFLELRKTDPKAIPL